MATGVPIQMILNLRCHVPNLMVAAHVSLLDILHIRFSQH